MTREEAINSFKKSNEQTKLNIQVHSHIMDTSEIRELEWYIERDKMAIEALEQPKTGHWIMHIDDLFPAESTMECSECGNHQPLTIDDNYCPNCGCRMESEVEQ